VGVGPHDIGDPVWRKRRGSASAMTQKSRKRAWARPSRVLGILALILLLFSVMRFMPREVMTPMILAFLAFAAWGCTDLVNDGPPGFLGSPTEYECRGPEGTTFPNDAVVGDGCNLCAGCEPCGASVCESACTAALCTPSQPETCTEDSDCGTDSHCTFTQGCGQENGYCVHVQSICPAPTVATFTTPVRDILCGCDGVSYASGSSSDESVCLRVKWRTRGWCP
jgi:hypothetical protein